MENCTSLLTKMARFYVTACLLLFLTTIAIANDRAKSTKTWKPPAAKKIAQLLGWVPYTNNKHICCGYYQEYPIVMPSNSVANETTWQADHAVLWQKKPSHAHGHIVVTQVNQQLTGNTLTMYPSESSKQPAKWDIYGNVHLHKPGMLAIGSKATVNLQQKTATLYHAIFHYHIPTQHKQLVYDTRHRLQTIKLEGKNLRGNAKRIDQVKPKLITLRNVSITTCDPLSNAWQLKTSLLKLNQATGMGSAYNARLLIHGVPVFYFPYFSFPIDNQRRSGFLTPDLNYSSQSGIIFNWPYYWNIAPNKDMTITPTYYSKRGLRMSSWFRYLNHKGSGHIYASLIPNDKLFATFQDDVAAGRKYSGTSTSHKQQANTLTNSSTNRYQLIWLDSTEYNRYLSSKVAINYVSDDYYLQDFGNGLSAASDSLYNTLPQPNQLIQLASLKLSLANWTMDTEVENFQTLHPINLGTDVPKDQYARLPAINIHGFYPDSLLGLNYNLDSQITNFQHPLLEGSFPTNLPAVTGMRYHTAASVSADLDRTWGYLKPQLILTGTIYRLHNPVASLAQQHSMHRVLPIYDIDAGLYFDRNVHLMHTDYRQTLEPRLFYLNVPYTEQNQLPLFDTQADGSLTYAALFNTNRFQGFDRIGDANQVAMGVTSRFIENASGNDIFDLSIGQILYLRNRQVQANQTNPPPALSKADTNNVSPLVGAVNWQFLPHWSTTGNAAYDITDHQLKSADFGIKYQLDNQHIFNIKYTITQHNSNADDLQQVNLGLSWEPKPRWRILAGINYDIEHHYSTSYLYGIQYNSCCWAIRLLTSRRYLGFASNGTTHQYNQEVYLQFVFKGLMSVGNQGLHSGDDMFNNLIPDYHDNFGRERLFYPT